MYQINRLVFISLSGLLYILICSKSGNCFFSEIDKHDIVFYETIEGEIEKENFTYYVVDSDDDILLNLTSLVGDCDMYVSQAPKSGQNPSKPTTELLSYDLQSTTCGEDSLFIDRYINRPFCIGIYAHPSYSTCSYKLEIIGAEPQHDEYLDSLEHTELTNHKPNKRQANTVNDNQFDEEMDTLTEFTLNFVIKLLGFVFELFML